MKISKRKARKFGLFTAICMVIGSVVGTGIFFKNASVFHSTGGNPTTTLVAWILSGVIALFAAISFSEIGTIVAGKNGLAEYAEKLIGAKAKNIISLIYPTTYFGIVLFAVSIFSSEAIFMAISPSANFSIKYHVGIIMALATGLYIFFIICNALSRRFGGSFQNISTVLKTIPMLLVIIIGFIAPGKPISTSSFVTGGTKPFDMSIAISLLPTILFAFDGFTVVMGLGEDTKNPKRTIPIAIFIGIVSTLGIYLLITGAQLYSGVSLSPKVIQLVKSSPWLYNFFWVVLAIGAMGVLNGISIGLSKALQHLINEELLPGTKKLNKTKINDDFKGVIALCIVYAIFFIIFGIPAIIMNSDAIIDASSNFPIVLGFMIYFVVIASQLINRLKIKKIQFKGGFKIHRYEKYRVKFNPINTIVYYTSTIITLIGIIIVIGYQLVQPFIDITAKTEVSFGVFANGGNHYDWVWTNWQLILLNLSILTISFVICIESYFYNKKQWKDKITNVRKDK